jgi:hypothetical protein
MNDICQDLKGHVSDVLVEWETLVRAEPWYSLPADHRIDSLPDVVVGLVQASLCEPQDEESHRVKVMAAADHGVHRREQGIPEHTMLIEYQLLRRAIWYYLVKKHGSGQAIIDAIMKIDTAISVATNASMWGYHREEIEALGKWDEGIRKIVGHSPLLRRFRKE